MSEAWVDVRLGDVFSLRNAKLGPHDSEPEILSLSKYDGFVRAADYFDKRIASTSLDGYKTVEPDEWAFSTIHIDEGSIARNTLGYRGVISPMYTTMAWSSEVHDPAFFELVLRSPSMLAAYADSAQGTVNRRRSLPFKTFAAFTISLPPLGVQRRIVDLMGSLDAHLANLETEAEAVEGVLRQMISVNEQGEVQTVALGELLIGIDAGKSPSGEDRVPEDGERAVLKVSAIGDEGFDPTAVKTVPDETLLPEGLAVRRGDVLMVRANGVLRRVGQVVQVPRDYPQLHLCDKSLRLVAGPTLDPGYLAFVLKGPTVRRRIERLTTGSDMRNISQKAIRQIEIPAPPLAVQQQIARQLSSLRGCVDQLRSETDTLRDLRSNLLSALLSREVEVPESYDELLGVAS